MTLGTRIDSGYPESVYSQGHNFKSRGIQVSTITQSTNRSPRRTESVEARHWIERQLRWERTLGSLRDHRAERLQPAKAA